MALPILAEAKRLFTLEEFEDLNIPSDGNKYELIDGEIIVTPPAGDAHGGVADTIRHYISLLDPERKLGRVRQATRYRVMPGFSPAPDLAFVKAERVEPVVTGAVPTRPDLVVEVWSPHDLETQNRREEARQKIRRYQIGGVPLIWAVNPRNRTVEIYYPDQIDPVKVLGVDAELDGENIIPGLKIPVKALFD